MHGTSIHLCVLSMVCCISKPHNNKIHIIQFKTNIPLSASAPTHARTDVADPASVKEPSPYPAQGRGSLCTTVDIQHGLKTAAKSLLNSTGMPPLHSGVVFTCVRGGAGAGAGAGAAVGAGGGGWFEPFEIAFGGGDWEGSGVWPVNQETPSFHPRICSKPLMGCFVPPSKEDGTTHR